MHEHDAEDDGRKHDVALEALVAVADGDVTQAASAYRTRHGRVSEQIHERNRHAAHKRGERFFQHHLHDDLHIARTEAMSCFDEVFVNLGQALLDDARHERSGRNSQRHHCARHAERRADNQSRERDDGHKQNDERD